MENIFWYIVIVQALICAGFCSFIAGEKNRSFGGWFANGLFFGIFALIAIGGLPSLSPPLLEKRESAPGHSSSETDKPLIERLQ